MERCKLPFFHSDIRHAELVSASDNKTLKQVQGDTHSGLCF
jgi:hypothetical protein